MSVNNCSYYVGENRHHCVYVCMWCVEEKVAPRETSSTVQRRLPRRRRKLHVLPRNWHMSVQTREWEWWIHLWLIPLTKLYCLWQFTNTWVTCVLSFIPTFHQFLLGLLVDRIYCKFVRGSLPLEHSWRSCRLWKLPCWEHKVTGYFHE